MNKLWKGAIELYSVRSVIICSLSYRNEAAALTKQCTNTETHFLFLSSLFQTRVYRKGEEESSNVKDAYVMIKYSAFRLSFCCSYLLPAPHTQSCNWWSDWPALWNFLTLLWAGGASLGETKSKALQNEGAELAWLLTYRARFVLMLKWEVSKWFLTTDLEHLINWINPILAFQPLIMSKSETRFLHYFILQQNENLRCLI